MRFERIDPHDEAAFGRWFAVRFAVDRFDWPDEPGWAMQELRALACDESDRIVEIELAFEDDTPVGLLWNNYPTSENTDTALVNLAVLPEHRRRGHGTALEAHAIELARNRGRSNAVGTTEAPLGASAGLDAFAKGLGYDPALPEQRRALTLPVDEDVLGPLYDDALAHSGDYELVEWIGRCPSHLVPGRLALAECISTDAPQGELETEGQHWDAERLEVFESTREQMERDSYSTGAVERATGDLVAFSELSVPRADPSTVYQWDTVVLPAHRGHRLGMLVKIANLRAIAASSPETRRIITFNASENEPMIAVNEAMGFELVGTGTVWKRSIA